MKKLLIIFLIALVSCNVNGQYLNGYQYNQVKSLIKTAIAPLNTSIYNLKIEVSNLKFDVANQTLQIKSLQDSINNYKNYFDNNLIIVSDTVVYKGSLKVTQVRPYYNEIYSP